MFPFPYLYALCLVLSAVLASRQWIHYFQLESYQFHGLWQTSKRNFTEFILPVFILFLISFAAAVVLFNTAVSLPLTILIQFLFGLLALGVGWKTAAKQKIFKSKKPLVFTARIKRLYGILTVTYVGSLFLLHRTIRSYWALPIWSLLTPLWFWMGCLLAWPIESLIQRLYYFSAQRILNGRPDLIKIGITGSYGKTSVKFILGTLLQEKFHTLISPASFNTPMGLTKVIRNDLRPSHQVFVAEMGARHRKDIRVLCKLVHPKYGIITSIGPQHLDTFHSIDQIRETKFDLIRALPNDGCAFFPQDHAICYGLYKQTKIEKRLIGLEASQETDVWAEEIKHSVDGCHFILCTRTDRITCQTTLLGQQNVQNILLAVSVCLRLGMSMQQIARGISRIKPVEHRMQLIQQQGKVTVIDDSFNTNPNSSSMALDVFSQFPHRRIIITPGMVELGALESKFNRQFGEQMADSVDIAILVGKKHTQPILEGLISKSFPQDNIYTVQSLNEATRLLSEITRPGDTLLFENDLPDNYSEN